MSIAAFDAATECTACERNANGGFLTAAESFTFHSRFKYRTGKIILDKYSIIEPHRSWQVFNWMQHFDHAAITEELLQSGFVPCEFVDGFASASDDEMSFGVMAKPK